MGNQRAHRFNNQFQCKKSIIIRIRTGAGNPHFTGPKVNFKMQRVHGGEGSAGTAIGNKILESKQFTFLLKYKREPAGAAQ